MLNDPTRNFTIKNDITPDAKQIAELYKRASLNRPVDNLDRLSKMYVTTCMLVIARRSKATTRQSNNVNRLPRLPAHLWWDFIRLAMTWKDENSTWVVTSKYPKAQFVLRASVIASAYYKHIGWQEIENGWFLPRENKQS